MNANRAMGMGLTISLGACAAGWVLLPSLRGPARRVEAEVSTRLEQARRLLHQYDAGLAYQSLLLQQLGERGLDVAASDLSEKVADEYQQIHSELWQAYSPHDWRGDTASPARASYGDIPDQIREGLDRQDQLAAGNRALLDEALAVVDQALAVTAGDVSARSHVEANRLKGVILYHQGLALWARAQLNRNEADGYRRSLMRILADVREVASTQSLVADSDIDVKIDRLESKADKTQASLAEDRRALAKVKKKISDLESRLASADDRLNQARKAMDRLKAEGVVFEDPEGITAFQDKLYEQDRIHREAAREIHAIQHGAYPNAQIDQSGDYLRGRYVEGGSSSGLTVEFGLTHFTHERTMLAARVERQQQAITDLLADVERLTQTRQRYQTAEQRTAARLTQAGREAADIHAELNRVESEAFAVEEEALGLLDRAARLAQQAGRSADDWIRDARDKTQNLSPEASQRSAFSARTDDGWIGAYVAAEEADARLAKAWIYQGRFRNHSENAQILASLTDALTLRNVDVESATLKANEARDLGVEEVSRAMQALQSAHNKAERHWTFVAQGAGAAYLMSLFGFDGYVPQAVEAYRNAVKGREKDRIAEPFVTRLTQLEKR